MPASQFSSDLPFSLTAQEFVVGHAPFKEQFGGFSSGALVGRVHAVVADERDSA